LLLAITSQHSGPEFVTHDSTCAQLSPFIAVSPALCRLASDRRLSAAADRVYRPQPQRFGSTVLVALLLLPGGIELIPGPSASPSSCVGLLNALSACHKAALIHDVIAGNKLDILLLTETWIPSDAPDAAKLDVAPSGYTVVHRHRAASTERRGGGLAVIHSDLFGATPVDVDDYSEFESLALRVVGHRSASFVVCVYRPPGTVTSAFTEQLSDCWTDSPRLTQGSSLPVTSTPLATRTAWTVALLTSLHVRSLTHRSHHPR